MLQFNEIEEFDKFVDDLYFYFSGEEKRTIFRKLIEDEMDLLKLELHAENKFKLEKFEVDRSGMTVTFGKEEGHKLIVKKWEEYRRDEENLARIKAANIAASLVPQRFGTKIENGEYQKHIEAFTVKYNLLNPSKEEYEARIVAEASKISANPASVAYNSKEGFFGSMVKALSCRRASAPVKPDNGERQDWVGREKFKQQLSQLQINQQELKFCKSL